MMRYSVAIFVCIFISCLATAQYDQRQTVHFTSYLQSEGLSQNSVHAIATDSSGFIWIGTEDGLNRFDGYGFRIFRRRPGGQSSLSWNNISTLALDSQTKFLWIGTIRKGISLYNCKTDSFRYLPLSITAKESNEWVNNITFIGNQAWIAADSGVVVFDRFKLTVQHTLRTGGKIQRIAPAGNSVLLYFEDGRVSGISKTALGPHPMTTAHFFDLPDGIRINDVLLANGGHYLVTNNGLFFLHSALPLNRAMPITVTTGEKDFTKAAFTTFHIDRKGRQWLGTEDAGLLVRYPGEQLFRHYSYHPTQAFSLSDNNITRIAEDKEENIWIGTQKGLNRVLKYPGWLHSYLNDGTVQNSPFNRVQTVFTPDNRIVFFAGKSGLYVLNRDGGKMAKVQLPLSELPDRFYAIKPIDEHRLLVSSSSGVQILKKQGSSYLLGQAEEYPELDSLKGLSITTIATADSVNYLLGGRQSAGCWLWNRQTHRLSLVSKGGDNPGYNVYHILPVADSFWIATNRGLYTWRLGRPFVAPFLPTHPLFAEKPHINSLAIDEGKLWMAFTSEGVGCLNLTTGKFIQYNTENGLRNNISYSIMADPYHRIWVSGVEGLAMISPVQNKIVYYNKEDGLQGTEFTNFSFTQNGSYLYFGGLNGLSVINTQAYQPSADAPQAVISRINVLQGNQFVEWGAVNNLSFSHRQNSFTFFLAVSDKGVQHRVSYRYRLVPLEKEWISIESVNSIAFTNLEPGKYRLEVIADDAETAGRSKPAVVLFTIAPAWYQTFLFKFAVVLLIAGILFFMVRLYYLVRLRKQQLNYEKLLAVQAERQRISAEIHDDLGAGLSAIRLLTELTRKKTGGSELHTEVDKIYTSVSDLSGKVREVIWSLNKENDTLENLLFYLQRQAYTLLESSGMEVSVQLPGTVPDVLIAGEKRRHIYLAVKEALHNALKHSGARNIWLKVTIEKAILAITVSDNGTGISKTGTEGNGLKNMRRRMAEVDGRFFVANNDGTQIRFTIPLNEMQ